MYLFTKRNVLHVLLFLIVVVSVMAAIVGQTASQEITTLSSSNASLAPRTESEQLVIDAYRKAKNAVVNVSTATEAYDFFGANHERGSGSGVVIDAKEALVITNAHVIAGASRVMVSLPNGQSYDVQLVGNDPAIDLALLRIVNPPKDLVSVSFGDSSVLEVGQHVLAIGSPFGLNRSLTEGIVSSLGRTIRSENGGLIEDIIQTDAAINPGNSGGPLLDTAGRLVGLNTAIVSRTGENAGIGFAIPVNQVREALPQLIKYGRVLRPKVGIILADTDYGPVVLYVQPGSPADNGDLEGARKHVRRGPFIGYVTDVFNADFILAVNGKRMRNKADVMDALSRISPDKKVELGVRRGALGSQMRVVMIQPVMG